MLPQQGGADEIRAVREIEDGILGSLLDGGSNGGGIIGDSFVDCTQRLNVQNAGVGGDLDRRNTLCCDRCERIRMADKCSEQQKEAEYPRSCACKDVERNRERSQLSLETRCTFT